MHASRLRSASKRRALVASDAHEKPPVAQVKIEVKEEGLEEEAETPTKTMERVKVRKQPLASSAPPPPPPPRGGLRLPARLGELPLRCVLTGTNPSQTAWNLGHAYAHRSNRFWPLLHSSPGVVPAAVALGGNRNGGPSPFSGTATDDELIGAHAGLGLCDVGTGHPETDSAAISSAAFASWAPAYYERLVGHVRRAAAASGCRCRIVVVSGEGGEEEEGKEEEEEREFHPSTCCAPRVIAFTGKRQFVELLNADKKEKKPKFDSSNVSYGLQPAALRPSAFPKCLSETELWVLTTTSGAAGLTNADRTAPWLELGRRLTREPWPREPPACVIGVGRGGAAAAVVAAAAAASGGEAKKEE